MQSQKRTLVDSLKFVGRAGWIFHLLIQRQSSHGLWCRVLSAWPDPSSSCLPYTSGSTWRPQELPSSQIYLMFESLVFGLRPLIENTNHWIIFFLFCYLLYMYFLVLKYCYSYLRLSVIFSDLLLKRQGGFYFTTVPSKNTTVKFPSGLHNESKTLDTWKPLSPQKFSTIVETTNLFRMLKQQYLVLYILFTKHKGSDFTECLKILTFWIYS